MNKKGFKIVTGTAKEVSSQVTLLQRDGWLLKGDPFLVSTKGGGENGEEPRFAQGLFSKSASESAEEVIERGQAGSE